MKRPENVGFKKKLLASALAFLIGVLAWTLGLDALVKGTPLGRLDARGSDYYSRAIERAAYTYAIVRGINGLVSVIQGTEIAASPAGVGVTVSAGEILDPVNDLMERFSWVMLISTASLGIQKLLMEIGAWFGFKLLLTLAMGVLLIGIWTSDRLRVDLTGAAYRMVLLALVIRFGIPLVALASEKVYLLFLEAGMTESTRTLEGIRSDIGDAAASEPGAPPSDDRSGYWDRLQKFMGEASGGIDLRERIAGLKERIADYARNTLNLITAFLLQTVVIPVAVLWGLWRLFGSALRIIPAHGRSPG
jgi:hypothetical protein